MNFNLRSLFGIIKSVDKPYYQTLKESDKFAIRKELIYRLDDLLNSDKRSGTKDYPKRKDEMIEQLMSNIIFKGDEREQFSMNLLDAIDSLK